MGRLSHQGFQMEQTIISFVSPLFLRFFLTLFNLRHQPCLSLSHAPSYNLLELASARWVLFSPEGCVSH